LISFLGGSRGQIGGPTGAFIVIIYGVVQQFGVDGLFVASFMTGLMLEVMGLLRLGSIIKFMPIPIVVGFTSDIVKVIFRTRYPTGWACKQQQQCLQIL
jgi:SulP family sulfate permease